MENEQTAQLSKYQCLISCSAGTQMNVFARLATRASSVTSATLILAVSMATAKGHGSVFARR
jgi:hypothetical protein